MKNGKTGSNKELAISDNYCRLRVKDIQDCECQRGIRKAWVKKNAREFDEKLFQAVHVGRRKNGTYVMVDGQHRLMIAHLRGIEYIDCYVFDSLGAEHEAEYFRKLNEAPKKPSPYDFFNAGRVERDPNVLAIDAIAKSAGFVVSSSNGNNKLSAVKAVTGIYTTYGADVLKLVLQVCREAHDGITESLKSGYLYALAEFISKKRHHENFQVSKFAENLRKYNPSSIMDQINKSTNKKATAVIEFIGVFNGKKKKNLID